MNTDHMATDNPVWGEPDPGPRHWGVRETAAAVGVAAVIAGLGGAAIYAATDSAPHPAGPRTASGPGGPGGPPGIGMHGPGPDSGGAISLHGEFVVPDRMGGYTTVLSQTGTVTAVSLTSLTVRSDDGFSQTYVIPQPAGPSPTIDDRVSVRATRTGQAATLTSITEPDGPGPGN
jgi:hypothetical protein